MDYSEKVVGNWEAGLSSPLMIQSNKSIEELKANPIYRVYTVIVSVTMFNLVLFIHQT